MVCILNKKYSEYDINVRVKNFPSIYLFYMNKKSFKILNYKRKIHKIVIDCFEKLTVTRKNNKYSKPKNKIYFTHC